jgi:hypothetical protein
MAKGVVDLFVVSVEAIPPLVWDSSPHQFRVGLCNTNGPSSAPAGTYRIYISYPGAERGLAQSDKTPATLKPGFNQILVGPWVPGLENHKASCASRPIGQIEVRYNDVPDPAIYRALPWPDGSTSINLKIACGGDYS